LKQLGEPFATHNPSTMLNIILELIWVISIGISSVVLMEMSKNITSEREQLKLDKRMLKHDRQRLELDRQNLHRGKVKHDKTKAGLIYREDQLVKMVEDLVTDVNNFEKYKQEFNKCNEFNKCKEHHCPTIDNDLSNQEFKIMCNIGIAGNRSEYDDDTNRITSTPEEYIQIIESICGDGNMFQTPALTPKIINN
jgi:hypothetical protein